MPKRKRDLKPTTTISVASSAIFGLPHQATVHRSHANGRQHIRNNFAFFSEPLPEPEGPVLETPLPIPPTTLPHGADGDNDNANDIGDGLGNQREFSTLVSYAFV